MKKLLESKYSILLLSFSGLVALVFLSAALRNIHFRPPAPFSFDLGGVTRGLGSLEPGIEIPIWRYILFAMLALMILAVVLAFFNKEIRKRILRRLLRMGLMTAALMLFINYVYDKGALRQLLQQAPAAGGPALSTATQFAAPVYVPAQISAWLVFLVSFAIGLILVLVAWFVYTRRLRSGTRFAMDEVADIARDALNDLQPGRNWDDAIVRAYIRMNEVVTAERGLIRQPGNTPAEFARRMERMGLPGEAVRALTGLFEGARYGGKTSSLAERDLAAAALSAILRYCGRNL